MSSKPPRYKRYAETTLAEYFKLSSAAELSPAHLPIPVKDIADSHYRIYVGKSHSLAEKLPDSVQERWMNGALSGLLLVGLKVKEIWVSAAEAERSQGRERFTIAHELGHFLMHTDEPTSASMISHFPKRGLGGFFACQEKDIHSATSRQKKWGKEAEANRFAAELLMPGQLVKKLFASLTDLSAAPAQTSALGLREYQWKACITKMANVFNVSSEAMGIRLTQLGLLSVL
ncbi:TPA: ImmA/IrrE family metallo-endopeptidase [Candidatus Poribacteria bacterium]|nr:ImmA/IrrE family metallo-endopeptidase [Candidatus Poribacteria bacterium]